MLDVLSLLGALSPMCPTHILSGAVQEEVFPSFSPTQCLGLPGFSTSLSALHSHAALLDTTFLTAGYPAPGQLQLSPMFFTNQSL